MKKKFIDTAKKVAQTLKQINGIKAIALQGNLAKGFVDKYSDIDLICLYEKLPSSKARRKVIEKLNIEKFVNKELPKQFTDKSEYFYFNGLRVSTYWIKQEDYEKSIKNFCLYKTTKNEFQNIISHIYYTKILYDPAEKFANLKKQIPKPRKGIIKYSMYHLNKVVYGGEWPHGEKINFERKRKNYIAINSEFIELIEHYLIIIFTLNGEYYTFPKWLPSLLKKMKTKPKNLIKRLNQLVYLGNDDKSINKKMKILTFLVNDLNIILKNKNPHLFN